MSLKQKLTQLNINELLPQTILISSNNTYQAFLDLSKFTTSHWQIDLEKYNNNALVISPNENENITIEQIRQLHKLLQQTTTNKAKVAVILNADLMNSSSANACLKILEEPLASTYMFLITSKTHKLLPTVRSRCYKISAQYQQIEEQNHYQLILQSLLSKDLLHAFEQVDPKKQWHDIAASCLLLLSNIIKNKSLINKANISQEEELLYKNTKQDLPYLLECFDNAEQLIIDVENFDLERRGSTITLLNILQSCLI